MINTCVQRANEKNKAIAKPRNVSHATVGFKRLLHLGRMKYDNIFIILFMSDPQQHFTMANTSKHSSFCLQVANTIHRLIVQQ